MDATALFQLHSNLAGDDPRFLAGDDWERWYFGCQYLEGRFKKLHPWSKELDDKGEKIPLDERRPYIYNVPKLIVDEPVAMLFDEDHWPGISVTDDAGQDFVAQTIKHAHLQDKWVELARTGGRVGSVAGVFKLIDLGDGKLKPCIEIVNGKGCKPKFARDGETLAKLVQLLKVHSQALTDMGYEGLAADKLYWYKREWTDQAEITYLPMESSTLQVPQFTIDPERTYKHKLGFVPAVWIKNLQGEDSVDGLPTYWAVLDLCDRLNYVFSQELRGIKYSSDPQVVFEGLDDEGVKALESGAGSSWRLRPSRSGRNPSAKLLEISGAGGQLALATIDQLREAIGEISRVMKIDPEKLAGSAQSGTALKLLLRPLIGLAAELRSPYGKKGLVAFVRIMLKVYKATVGAKLDLPGLTAQASAISEDLDVELKWPDWFPPGWADIQAAVTACAAAVEGGFISRESAMQKLAKYFDIEDIEAEWGKIDAERAERQKAQAELGNALLQNFDKGTGAGAAGGQ